MHVVTATRQQMVILQDWALAEGWQPGRGDVDAFHATDPEGFFIGFDEGDRPVATISLVKYSATYAFLGYYIVAAGVRGRGFGRRIWDHAVEPMQGVTIGLDGVLAQESMYAEAGFRTQYHTVRYSGEVGDLQQGLTAIGQYPAYTGSGGLTVREATPDELTALVAFDSRHVPVPRPRFVQQWLSAGSPRRSFVAMTGNTVVGLATVRPALPDGYRIGPLFADDAVIATQLLEKCVAGLDPKQLCAIDVPTSNRDATNLVHAVRMTPGFTAARMYRGHAPEPPCAGVFGVTSLELG